MVEGMLTCGIPSPRVMRGGEDVVARRVAVVEWLIAEPVSERVDAEGGLLDEEDAKDAGVDYAALPVAPAETGDESGEDEAHEKDDPEVVLVLPSDDCVLVEVGNVGAGRCAWGSASSTSSRSGSKAGPCGRTAAADGRKEDLERECGAVGCVRPETMVSSRYAQAGPIVVENGPGEGLCVKRCVECLVDAEERDADDEEDVGQLTCLYQFCRVMGCSVMWGFLGSYFGFLFGSDDFAIGDGCDDWNSGFTASMPAAG
ncbi:hypothetical protein MRB53_039431 [Persea americana]|nr:hypothetical protein MRB53_039431 [Persea americana]